HLVHPPGESIEHPPRLRCVPRLAEHHAVDVHLRVAGQDSGTLDGPCLAQGVLEDDLARVALRQLVDVRRADVELDPELLEDRLALRRSRSER
ncbi:MAG TPA: hypothetical protein VH247_13725, partial [Thermoleophilaceae bacterium]|nr:hypothetical protein [Thermoleophilaceae bacterium]